MGRMGRLDLVVLGEVALDVILAGVDRVPRRWSELGRVREAGIFAAGSAGYVAQCFSKLGGQSAIVGRVGDDTVGRITIDGLQGSGVSTRFLIVDKTVATEISTVIVYNDGNKTSVISEIPKLRLNRPDPRCLKGARSLHIGGYLLMPELWGKSLLNWIRFAKREGAVVSLDPQMSATGAWREALDGVLQDLDILFVDEEEVRRISRKRKSTDAAKSLSLEGPPIVAVKAGRGGCIVSESGRILQVRSFKTRPVSTIGAGDAFDAAFIYGRLQNWTTEKIARFSNVVAALSMTKLGCMTAIPPARDAMRIAESYYRGG
jgi:sugar/nucleoside kinase (ribokinase family)